MKIALDAMGGDFGPPNLVAGAVMALRAYPRITKLFLVGDSAKIESELTKHGCTDDRIEIFHTSQVVAMSDGAVEAVRRKKDSSVSRAVDLVKVRTGDGRECFYLGGGGVGLDAAAAAYAGGPCRNFPGRMRYVAAALRAYFSYQPRRVRVTFESDDTDQAWQSAVLASVLNTPTFGAGIRLAPGAQIDDGVLEFVFLEELRFGQLVRALPRLALQGSINLPGLRTRSARKLRIEVDPPATFQGDGELLGSSPVEIEIVPRAMRFLAPRAAAL